MTGTEIWLLLLVLTAVAGVASYWVGHRQRLALLREQHAAAIAARQTELRLATQQLLGAIQQAQVQLDEQAEAANRRQDAARATWEQQITHLRQELAAQHAATQQQLAQLEATLRETVDLNL